MVYEKSDINDSENQFITRTSLIRFSMQAILQLSGLIYLPILTSNLPQYVYGQWSLAISVATGVASFATLCLALAIVRYYKLDQKLDIFPKIFNSSICWAVIVCSIGLVISYLSRKYLSWLIFNTDQLSSVSMGAICLGIAVSFRALLSSVFRAELKVLHITLVEFILLASRIALVSWLAINKYSITMLVWSQVAAEVLTCLYWAMQTFSKVPPEKVSLAAAKPYLKFALPLLPGGLLLWAGLNIEKYFLVHYWGSSEVGKYNVAVTISSFFTATSAAIIFCLFPQLSTIWNGDSTNKKVAELFAHANKIMLLVGVPAIIGIYLTWEQLVIYVANEHFVTTPSTAVLVATGKLFAALYIINSYAWQLRQKTPHITLVLSAGVIFNICLAYWLTPKLASLGAAMALFATQTFLFMLALRSSHNLLAWSIEFKFFAKCFACCIFMVAMMKLAHLLAFKHILIQISIGATAYLIASIISGLISTIAIIPKKR